MPDEKWNREIWFGKLKEVIDKYEPDIIWFDSWLDEIPEQYRYEFCNYYLRKSKERNKEVVIVRKQNDLPLSVSVENLENSRKSNLHPVVWETDETVSYGSWSYTTDLKIKPSKHLIHELIDIVSKNGVLLLNVSPRASGEIPADQQKVLLEIGEWLKQNGEAIYNTRPWYTYGEGPTKEPEGSLKNRKLFDSLEYTSLDYRFTRKGNTVYVLTMGELSVGTNILLKSFVSKQMAEIPKIQRVTILGSTKTVNWKMDRNGLILNIPEIPNKVSIVYKVELQ